jgi:hypothetical protein
VWDRRGNLFSEIKARAKLPEHLPVLYRSRIECVYLFDFDRNEYEQALDKIKS